MQYLYIYINGKQNWVQYCTHLCFCLLPAQPLGSTILLTAGTLYLLTVGIYLRHVLVRGTNVRFDRIQLVHQMT